MLRKDKYANTFMGIDTTKNLNMSCLVTGPKNQIKDAHNEIKKLFEGEGIKTLHYKEIKKLLENYLINSPIF